MKPNFMKKGKYSQGFFLPKVLTTILVIFSVTAAYSQDYRYKDHGDTPDHIKSLEHDEDMIVLNNNKNIRTSAGIRFQTVSSQDNHKSFSIYNNYEFLNFSYSDKNDSKDAGVKYMTLSNTGKLSVLKGMSIGDSLTVGSVIIDDDITIGHDIIVRGDYTGRGFVTLHAFEGPDKEGTAYIQSRNNTRSTAIGLQFRTQPGTGEYYRDAMKIDPEGNVGIGTINPDGRLSIVGAGAQVKVHLANSSANGYTAIRFGKDDRGDGQAYLHRFNEGFPTVGMWEPSSIGFYESVGSMNIGSAKSFKIFTGGNESASERLRIDTLGNVGIGTTSPDGLLSIVGASAQVKVHLANSSANGYTAIRFGKDDRGDGQAYLHRFNEGFPTVGMWEPSSIGFYESEGSMNIGSAQSFKIFTGGNESASERLRIDQDGNVGIGTTEPGAYKLAVNGNVKAKQIEVNSDGWADFVFEADYELKDLKLVEEFIERNGHLPGVPSAEEVTENGINLGKMDAVLLQKIEELTLYVIALKKENEQIKATLTRDK